MSIEESFLRLYPFININDSLTSSTTSLLNSINSLNTTLELGYESKTALTNLLAGYESKN